MEQVTILLLIPALLILTTHLSNADTVLSAVLTPSSRVPQQRQQRSYEYYERYGSRRPLYDRRDSCGRCDDRYDDKYDDKYDDDRDRYDDDRRSSHRPTTGGRHDEKDYDDRRYDDDRKGAKNETGDDSKSYEDKDRNSGRRHRDRDKDRNRHGDRDRYRPDDRYSRDPYRDRYDRPYYDDPYRERRPYDRYYPYSDRYDYDYPGYYSGYRRPYYEDRYDRGSYDSYGGYGPVGRGPHDRPWDETYRGQAGWDAGGRGYYFASGKPETTVNQYWPRQEYARPQSSGWQGLSYSSYREPVADYRGSFGYAQGSGYRQAVGSGYGQSGWHSVGERRPYRDQSGVSQLDNNNDGKYSQSDNRQQVYGQYSNNQGGLNSYGSSSTTPGTSYLFGREDDIVTEKSAGDSSKAPS